MSRSSVWVAALCVLFATSAHASCLPPIFENGTRLAAIGEVRVAHLALLLRQHEICRRSSREPEAKNIVVLGSSGVFGHPLPADRTWWWKTNEALQVSGSRARLFNLAFVFTYQLKDAIILHESLSRFPVDLIVYGITLDDFHHAAPLVWPEGIVKFLDVNASAARALARTNPPGLEELLSAYEDHYRRTFRPAAWTIFREGGSFVRELARTLGEQLRDAGGAHASGSKDHVKKRRSRRREPVSCEETHDRFARSFEGWKDWNVLAYLERVQDEGTPVLVVNWPTLREERGDCFNERFPADAYEDYLDWLEAETKRRHLSYVDLHKLLPPSAFLDAQHPNEAGQEPLSDAVTAALMVFLDDRGAAGATNRRSGAAPESRVAHLRSSDSTSAVDEP
jgi:hypothetical protein